MHYGSLIARSLPVFTFIWTLRPKSILYLLPATWNSYELSPAFLEALSFAETSVSIACHLPASPSNNQHPPTAGTDALPDVLIAGPGVERCPVSNAGIGLGTGAATTVGLLV